MHVCAGTLWCPTRHKWRSQFQKHIEIAIPWLSPASNHFRDPRLRPIRLKDSQKACLGSVGASGTEMRERKIWNDHTNPCILKTPQVNLKIEIPCGHLNFLPDTLQGRLAPARPRMDNSNATSEASHDAWVPSEPLHTLQTGLQSAQLCLKYWTGILLNWNRGLPKEQDSMIRGHDYPRIPRTKAQHPPQVLSPHLQRIQHEKHRPTTYSASINQPACYVLAWLEPNGFA